MVVGALGGSAWLFAGDLIDGDTKPAKPAPTDSTDETGDVLSLPNGDEPTDDRRRGTEGRDRLDPDTGAAGTTTDESSTDTEDDPAAADLPAAYASLRDRRIAIVAASSDGTGDVTKLVRVSGLRVPCATPGARDALEVELAMATLTADVLDTANASVTGSREDEFGSETCVDARVKGFADADVALVYRVVPDGDDPRVLVGRAIGAPDASSTTLAAEVAAALGLDAVTASRTAATRTLLANVGAIDAPEGASVVLVEVPATRLTEEGSLQVIVDDVVGAVAAYLARADEPAT
ncbi:MAG: hypothetical protein JWL76_1559 [Thermoleophilia bacterium]|nr:hypothetical protein [Thermoleophilia bacterium]